MQGPVAKIKWQQMKLERLTQKHELPGNEQIQKQMKPKRKQPTRRTYQKYNRRYFVSPNGEHVMDQGIQSASAQL
jgi:hypothetical protein